MINTKINKHKNKLHKITYLLDTNTLLIIYIIKIHILNI